MAAKPNLRLLLTGSLPDPRDSFTKIKSIAGGFLMQSRDSGMIGPDDLKVVTKRTPTAAEMTDLMFAWKVAKHVKSNAIVFVKDGSTVNLDSLVKAGIVTSPKHPLKILGNGDLSVKLTVQAAAFTASARTKIESAGGSCEILD